MNFQQIENVYNCTMDGLEGTHEQLKLKRMKKRIMNAIHPNETNE